MLKQSIIELYIECTPSDLPRRRFLERQAQIAGDAKAALAMLSVLENKYAMAQVVAEQDNRLTTGTIEIQTPNGPIQAYFAQQKNGFCKRYLKV